LNKLSTLSHFQTMKLRARMATKFLDFISLSALHAAAVYANWFNNFSYLYFALRTLKHKKEKNKATYATKIIYGTTGI